MDPKYIVEKNGEKEEVSKEKFEDYHHNPDFKVTEESSKDDEKKIRVQTRLYD